MKYNQYTPKYAVDAYILAKQGMDNRKISQCLKTSNLKLWMQRHPEFLYAIETARNKKTNRDAESFREYVYKQLSPDLKELWDKIDLWVDHDLAHERIESILSRESKRVRQHLWMHAMVHTNFNMSESCRRVNITRAHLQQWIEKDPGFAELLDEIIWHKKNYFENGLIGLVAEKDVNAIIFANRTQNKDRGYSDKISVEHSGTVNVNMGITLSVDQLALPLEVRKLILEKMRTLALESPQKAAPKLVQSERSSIVDLEAVA